MTKLKHTGRIERIGYKVTEASSIPSIDIRFDYHDIEVNGAMITYNDLLPHGKAILLDMDEENWIIYDQHCVKPNQNKNMTNPGSKPGRQKSAETIPAPAEAGKSSKNAV